MNDFPTFGAQPFEPICTCGMCDIEQWTHNVQRIGRAARLRNRDARWLEFRPDDSPTLRASGLDLRSEFDAATIARIAREAVRPSKTGPPRF